MAIVYEGVRTANFLIADNLYQSREEGIVDTDEALLPGSFVAKAATQGTAAGVAGSQNTGNGTIGAVTVAAAGQSGAYTATFTSPTAFTVRDPAGTTVATGAAGTAFNNQIGFTITAGSAAFVAGDVFVIDVDVTEFNYVAAATAGAIDGILFEGITDADIDSGKMLRRTVIARDAEVQLSGLVLGAFNQSAVIARLNTVGIAVRIH